MNIKTEFITIQGAPLEGANPLPHFRERNHDTHPVDNGTLRPEDNERFGTETAFRVLPYRMQDRYSRKKRTMEITGVVMENEFLRAEFLPDYGGRLYSLKEKTGGKELLYRNPVFQPANLAIRNAWFSGGIEWNITQLGHSCSTCDKVFFAKVRGEDGYEFLRMYDYERTRGLLWQIDFHLPDGSRQLYAHTVIINDTDKAVPMYWWTNIAAREEEGCRIFSGTREVLYIEPQSLSKGDAHSFGRGELPSLPVLPEKDASYPENFHYTSEYFFQNPKTMDSPWEAITYTDGSAFFERSTQPLYVRKMFCWGSHNGGRTWRDYLSVPGKGNYVEIQAGLAPTQLHTIQLDAHEVISFTQCYGSLSLESGDANLPDYESARMLVKTAVNAAVSADKVKEMDGFFSAHATLPCSKLIHSGHGWGALEQARRLKEGQPLFPRQFTFPAETLTTTQENWLALLWDGPMEELTSAQVPLSFQTDPAWLPYLKHRVNAEPDNVTALLLMGILLYENGAWDYGTACWKKALQHQNLPILWRNLACAAAQEGNNAQAVAYMEQAHLESYPDIDRAFYAEYFRYLLIDGQAEKIFALYQNLPESLQNTEVLLLEACEAAEQLLSADDGAHNETTVFGFLEDAFTRDYALIREGETRMSDIWFAYARKKGIRSDRIPRHLDMRLTD